MAIRDEVMRILSERAVHRINFNYGRVRLNAEVFAFVQGVVSRDAVSIGEDPDLPSGASARYDRGTHTLYFWPHATEAEIRRSPECKSVVVHECAHIAIHLRCGSHVASLDDEVAAFLAQTIYRLALQGYAYRGSSTRDGSFSSEVRQYATTPAGRVFAAAQQIVLDHQMLDHHHCTPLFEPDVQPLKQALQMHPNYG